MNTMSVDGFIAKIEYDAENATVAVTFRATGIAALCARQLEEAA